MKCGAKLPWSEREEAVLFRASSHSAGLEIELTRKNIRFVKFGGLKFLEAAHIKDVIAVLRWAQNLRGLLEREDVRFGRELLRQ